MLPVEMLSRLMGIRIDALEVEILDARLGDALPESWDIKASIPRPSTFFVISAPTFLPRLPARFDQGREPFPGLAVGILSVDKLLRQLERLFAPTL